MDLKGIDLNLLQVFAAMAEHGSVTRAGESIGLSQPAMSAALGRLRTLFDDPLFVRSGALMQPTPRAQELAEPVRRVIDTIRHEILPRSSFDATTTERRFTLVTPDIGEINFVPRLLAHLVAQAPRARLRAISRQRSAAADTLESGAADLAVGYFPDLQRAGFYQQKLFDNTHVCIVRQDHPKVGATLTVDDYLRLDHVVVQPDGREHVFEQHLQAQGVRRRVLLELSHFMSLLPIIEGSDLVATVPRDLAEVCRQHADVRIVESPLPSPVIPVHQFWHARFHRDPANAWLRGAIHALFAASGASPRR